MLIDQTEARIGGSRLFNLEPDQTRSNQNRPRFVLANINIKASIRNALYFF